MRIVFGVLLMVIAFIWIAFWSAAAGTASETGNWNSAMSALMIVAALGLIPGLGGLYLVGSWVYRLAKKV